jgi:hypothetical protein
MNTTKFAKGTQVTLITNEGRIVATVIRYSNTKANGFQLHFSYEGQEFRVGRTVAATAQPV